MAGRSHSGSRCVELLRSGEPCGSAAVLGGRCAHHHSRAASLYAFDLEERVPRPLSVTLRLPAFFGAADEVDPATLQGLGLFVARLIEAGEERVA